MFPWRPRRGRGTLNHRIGNPIQQRREEDGENPKRDGSKWSTSGRAVSEGEMRTVGEGGREQPTRRKWLVSFLSSPSTRTICHSQGLALHISLSAAAAAQIFRRPSAIDLSITTIYYRLPKGFGHIVSIQFFFPFFLFFLSGPSPSSTL